jgi:hypothetical protein
VHEEDGKPFELEMTWLCEESGWKHCRVRAFGGGEMRSLHARAAAAGTHTTCA